MMIFCTFLEMIIEIYNNRKLVESREGRYRSGQSTCLECMRPLVQSPALQAVTTMK
jgi:hypothetical protein